MGMVRNPFSMESAPTGREGMAASALPPRGTEASDPRGFAGAAFRTTHWSQVLCAGRTASPEARQALEGLCSTYWYPLYAFVRRRGHGPEDAQDLVQGFFARFLARDDLASVHPDKGRFRTFLLAALAHHLANEWDRARALKRGGGLEFLPLDDGDPEERFLRADAADLAPESTFDRSWAERMLETVLSRLRQECDAEGRAGRFDALKGFLLGERGDVPYATVADQLGTSEQGVKSAVHRLRQRFRDTFREEVARTVANPAEVDDELRHLIRVMAR